MPPPPPPRRRQQQQHTVTRSAAGRGEGTPRDRLRWSSLQQLIESSTQQYLLLPRNLLLECSLLLLLIPLSHACSRSAARALAGSEPYLRCVLQAQLPQHRHRDAYGQGPGEVVILVPAHIKCAQKQNPRRERTLECNLALPSTSKLSTAGVETKRCGMTRP